MKQPVTLHLNLHREYFAQIAAGTKRIEYRRRTSYWRRRLEGRDYDVIHAQTSGRLITIIKQTEIVKNFTKFLAAHPKAS